MKILFGYTLFFHIVLVFNCGLFQKIPIVARHYKSDEFDIAIFPKEYEYFENRKRFTPTIIEVKLVEDQLKKEISSLNRELINQDGTKYGPFIHKNIKKYKRQYFGYFNEDQERILYINCFWDIDDYQNDWLNSINIVLDGGSYYWSIKYNLDRKVFFQMMVNGHA